MDIVGGIPTSLKNMSSSIGMIVHIVPNIWKNKNVPNHQPGFHGDSWEVSLIDCHGKTLCWCYLQIISPRSQSAARSQFWPRQVDKVVGVLVSMSAMPRVYGMSV